MDIGSGFGIYFLILGFVFYAYSEKKTENLRGYIGAFNDKEQFNVNRFFEEIGIHQSKEMVYRDIRSGIWILYSFKPNPGSQIADP